MKLEYYTLTMGLKIMASQPSQIGTRIIYLIQEVGMSDSFPQISGGISYVYEIQRLLNLIQLTGTIQARSSGGKNEQVLDKLKVERERGITGLPLFSDHLIWLTSLTS